MQKSSALSGKFITFEGIEGVGKSTNIKFAANIIQQIGVDVLTTREPGGTPMGEDLRHIILANYAEKVLAETETLLLFASRAQHVHNVIMPALLEGKCVLCDRFTDATYAYQGGGRGVPKAFISSLEQMVQGDLRPDLTLIFDVDVEVGLRRARDRGESDRFENEELDFFEHVRNEYLVLAKENPARYQIINANQTLEEVQQNLRKILERY